MLAYLQAHPNEVVSRDELYREVWGWKNMIPSRTLDNTICHLRKRDLRIETVWGIGYKLIVT